MAEPRLREQGFKQLDWVSRRVFGQDLLAADAGHDIVPKTDTCFTKGLDEGGDI